MLPHCLPDHLRTSVQDDDAIFIHGLCILSAQSGRERQGRQGSHEWLGHHSSHRRILGLEFCLSSHPLHVIVRGAVGKVLEVKCLAQSYAHQARYWEMRICSTLPRLAESCWCRLEGRCVLRSSQASKPHRWTDLQASSWSEAPSEAAEEEEVTVREGEVAKSV